jgi:hypothetical protein
MTIVRDYVVEVMSMNNEQLANRFVEILAERANRNGLTVPRWSTLPANWQRVWIETVPAFLEELGLSLPVQN